MVLVFLQELASLLQLGIDVYSAQSVFLNAHARTPASTFGGGLGVHFLALPFVDFVLTLLNLILDELKLRVVV